ncbi:MAG: SDR family NAD(P)-dependent oxidoreductase, partial [Actinomycetota bacterium]
MNNGSAVGALEGRVALITGGSRGIGLGIAKKLVSLGARVCVTARREPDLTAAIAELGGRLAEVVRSHVA